MIMTLDYIPPGALVGVNVNGVIHPGIMSDGYVEGERAVISRSRRSGQALEESWTTFTGGRKGFLLPPLSGLAPLEVLHNAKSLIGTRWDFFSANCEHFVSEAFGVKPTSPQLRLGLAVLVIGLVIVAVQLRGK
jgi:hypothetical protein